MEFDINKNSYCLTINNEKYDFLCERFKKVGITPPKKFEGFVAKGCMHYVRSNTYGQLAIVEMARQMNLPYVVIFEDDAYPRNDIKEIIPNIYNSINDMEFDVLYLGRNGDAALWNDRIENLHRLSFEEKEKYSNPIKIDDYLSKIDKNIFGNHAYVVFNRGYDNFIYTFLHCMINMNMCYADIILSGSKLLQCICVSSPLFIQYNKDNNEVIHISKPEECSGYIKTESINNLDKEVWR